MNHARVWLLSTVAILSTLALLVDFARWRFDLKLLQSIELGHLAGIGGLGLFTALLIYVWGRKIGKLLIGLSVAGFGLIVLNLLFDKSAELASFGPLALYSGGALVGGIVLLLLGSEQMEYEIDRDRAEGAAWRATSVICAACDQFLGTTGAFKTPCPRCGSNRYTTE